LGVVEALIFAKKEGIDLEKVLKAISSGSGGSKSLDYNGRKILDND